MKVTPKSIGASKHYITTIVVKQLSVNLNITTEEAFKKFLGTKTYNLLSTNESYLWNKSPEYVYDMINSELSNDIDGWLTI